jgi:hypothetical protein
MGRSSEGEARRLGEVLQAYVPTEIPLPRTTETDEPSRLIEVRAAYIDVQGCFGS